MVKVGGKDNVWLPSMSNTCNPFYNFFSLSNVVKVRVVSSPYKPRSSARDVVIKVAELPLSRKAYVSRLR